jgi:hypothetical protein
MQSNRFNEFFAEFKNHDLWKDMKNTRENSPWHREANVAVHTGMVLDWYTDNLANSRTDYQQMLTRVAALFHDTGKPKSEQIKENEERGVYRSYAGHEQVSSRIWVDYAITHRELVGGLLRFSTSDIFNIAQMLEYHVPFGLKDKIKRQNLKKSFIFRMGESGHRAWIDLLLSDQHGRNSDDQATKLANVDIWLKDWEKL